MEYKDIVKFIMHHYKILIIGVILGGLAGLVFTYLFPAPYEASSKILISRNKPDKNSDFGYLTDQQLIQTYAYILKTQPILDLVDKQMNSKVDPANVRVSQVADTMILQITVRDDSAQKAAYFANAFAKAMVTRSKELQEEQYVLKEEGLSSQITAVQSQIDLLESQYDQRESTVTQSLMDDVDKQILAYRNEILTLQKEIAVIKTPTNLEQQNYVIERNARLDEIQPLLSSYQQIRTNLEYLGRPYQAGSSTPEDTILARLQNTITQYQDVSLVLVNELETTRLEKIQNSPTVQTIEEAKIPSSRTSLSFILNPVIAGGVGLILSALLALALQQWQVKITSQKQLLESLDLEMIGKFGAQSNLIESTFHGENLSDDEERSFYNIRTYIEFQQIKTPIKSLLITSFTDKDGKSTLAANLAKNYAFGGNDVVLVDANFVHSELHRIFKVQNNKGLSDILFNTDEFTRVRLRETAIKHLCLLPAGAYEPQPMQLLDPQKMDKVIRSIETGKKLVIIDGSTMHDLNSRLLASVVDKILVVMRSGVYSVAGLKADLNTLTTDKTKILGVVLNEAIQGEHKQVEEQQKESSTQDLWGPLSSWEAIRSKIGASRETDEPSKTFDSVEHNTETLEISDSFAEAEGELTTHQVHQTPGRKKTKVFLDSNPAEDDSTVNDTSASDELIET